MEARDINSTESDKQFAIEVSMLCVQPLAFQTEVFADGLARRLDIQLLERICLDYGAKPDWLVPHRVSRRGLESIK